MWWRTWQAAISSGDLHARIEPEISEFDNIRKNPEKETYAGNWNILVPVGRENKLMMPLVAASEKGTGQTESFLEREVEMW